MPAVRRAVALCAALAAIACLLAVGLARSGMHSQDRPWSRLDPGEPIGAFTGRKLTALGGDGASCRALLDRAGIAYARLPPRDGGAHCGYDDAVRFTAGGAMPLVFRPQGVGVSCAVAAALAMWDWDVVQPAARRFLGTRAVAVDHFGSYNCRRIAGRTQGAFSEHARANAIDIAGFRFADGTRATIARDWAGDGPRARFLHAVRNGACRLFATTLSPDYNAAHHDHLHLDQAARGSWGARACR